MPKLTRIYTRTGDKGMTGLIGGTRVAKNSPRIEAYGTLDELSSAVGVARTALTPRLADLPRAAALDEWLAWTQDLLFNLGSELATPPEHHRKGASMVGADDIAALERAIDRAQKDLPALANFIHPGGSLPGAQLHFARTICRRAERLLVGLVESEAIEWSAALPYLNRLSDALFVWARWINDAFGVPEHIWNPSAEPPKS